MSPVSRVRILFVLSAVVSTPRLAWAGGGAATDSYEGIGDGKLEVHGLLDVYAQYDFQLPASSQVLYRAFDFRGRALAGAPAPHARAHQPRSLRVPHRRRRSAICRTAYMQSDPAATQYPGLARGLSYIEQAFVTVRPPPVPEFAVDVGKFSTPIGFEDNESITNWNYSRSLLFTLAEPTYHTATCRTDYVRTQRGALGVGFLAQRMEHERRRR